MNKYIFLLALTLSPLSYTSAQTVIDIHVEQNPPLKAEAATVVTDWAEGGVTLGADLVVSGGDGHYAYEWTDEKGTILGTEPKCTVLQPGRYYLKVSDGAGCAVSSMFQVNTTSGIANARGGNGTSIEVSGHTLTVETTSGLFLLRVADTAGHILMRSTYNSNKADVDLSNLADGAYIICVTEGEKAFVKKIILKD